MFSNTAAAWLRSEGYVVIPPGAAQLDSVAKVLRDRGCRVFPPHDPPPVGSVWKPNRGTSAARVVLGCEQGRVQYRNLGTGELRDVVGRTWETWVTEARARVVENACSASPETPRARVVE